MEMLIENKKLDGRGLLVVPHRSVKAIPIRVNIAGSIPAPSTKVYECKVCNQTFLNKNKYASHNRWKHQKNEEKYKCTKCERKFKYKSSHVIHEKFCKPTIRKLEIIELVNNIIYECDYGCKQKANFILKSGKKCCSRFFVKCPAVKLKIKTNHKNTKKKAFECNICGKIVFNNTHEINCKLTQERVKKIRELYDKYFQFDEIVKSGFSKSEIHYALKGHKKRSLSEMVKRAHAEKRMHEWKPHESYAETFFNKVLTNEGYIQSKDYFREFPFSIYRADFFFPNLKLVIEIDGIQHFRFKHQQKTDQRKNNYLNAIGIDVMRVPWTVVRNDAKNVLKEILDTLKNRKTFKGEEIIKIFNNKQLKKLLFIEEIRKIKDEQERFNKINKIKEKKINEQKIKERIKEELKARELIKKEKLKNERIRLLEGINLNKFGWVAKVMKLWNVSHTQAKRYIRTHFPDLEFYEKNNASVAERQTLTA